MSENIAAPLELPEKLVIKVVSVGQNDERRVLHRVFANHASRKEQHRETLPTSLRVPDHSRPSIPRFSTVHPARPIRALFVANTRLGQPAGSNRFFHRCIHCVELVITRDDFVNGSRIRVFFKDDEMLEQIQKTSLLEHASDERLKLESGSALHPGSRSGDAIISSREFGHSLIPSPSPNGRREVGGDFVKDGFWGI